MLRQLKNNLQTDFENEKKKLTSVTKQTRNIEKEQTKVDRLRASIAAKESETNAMEERLNQTKPLDDLKERESELRRQNEEDQAIIQDENASPSDIEAARESGRKKRRARTFANSDCGKGKDAASLGKNQRDLQKIWCDIDRYSSRRGVTIGAVVGSITNALKATGKALGKGLKDIGAKLGSLLPGLIGSIVNFLFKAAGQAIGFLAEHTWLLILAAVAFLFEKYIKKRR